MIITTRDLNDRKFFIQGIRLTNECLLIAVSRSLAMCFDSDIRDIEGQLNELHLKTVRET